jgi:hypothetical protein
MAKVYIIEETDEYNRTERNVCCLLSKKDAENLLLKFRLFDKFKQEVIDNFNNEDFEEDEEAITWINNNYIVPEDLQEANQILGNQIFDEDDEPMKYRISELEIVKHILG